MGNHARDDGSTLAIHYHRLLLLFKSLSMGDLVALDCVTQGFVVEDAGIFDITSRSGCFSKHLSVLSFDSVCSLD